MTVVTEYFIGIDPGQKGAIVKLARSEGELTVEGFVFFKETKLTVRSLIKGLPKWNTQFFVYMEDVHAIYGSSAKGTFNFGKQVGILEGCLCIQGIDHTKVQPKEWQKGLNIPPRMKQGRKFIETSSEYKLRLRDVAEILFPNLEMWNLSVNSQLQLCDALLIAEYIRRMNQSKPAKIPKRKRK